MENKQDLSKVVRHIESVKGYIDRSLDSLNSINMIVVDNNNGRVKDAEIASRIGELETKLGQVSNAVSEVKEYLEGGSR
ncbi:MAG: hypothetical protein ACOYIF_12955 [Acetivibrionales bacterium]|jgi:hypothetical protein